MLRSLILVGHAVRRLDEFQKPNFSQSDLQLEH